MGIAIVLLSLFFLYALIHGQSESQEEANEVIKFYGGFFILVLVVYGIGQLTGVPFGIVYGGICILIMLVIYLA